MSDTEILSIAERCRWKIEPLIYGGWCIDGLNDDGRYVRLCLTDQPSLRDALGQAMRRQRRLALDALVRADADLL